MGGLGAWDPFQIETGISCFSAHLWKMLGVGAIHYALPVVGNAPLPTATVTWPKGLLE